MATSPGGEWVAVPVPGAPDRWDFVPVEQPPSPDGTAGTWHVVGGSGVEVGTWEWFPARAPVRPEPVTWAPSVSEPAWPTMPEPASWRNATPEPTHIVFPVPPPADWASAQPVLTPAPKRSRKLPLAIIGGVVAIAAIAGGAAVALGDGDDGRKQDEITALVNLVTTADDGADVCRSHLTENFVRTVFGDIATCERDDDTDGDEGDATGATVTDFSFAKDDATALVTINGGDTDGATGTWAFHRGEDEVWRVSEWRVDFLRSSYDKTFGVNYASDGPNDPFDDVEVRTCVRSELLGQNDAAFLDTAYALFRDSDQSTPRLLGLLSQCPSDIAGVSALRALFEKGMRTKLGTQLPPLIAECAISGWRTAVSEEEIRAMMQNPGTPLSPEVQSRMQQVLLGCAGVRQEGAMLLR